MELKSEITSKFHAVEQRRLIIQWLITILVTALLSISATLYIRALFESTQGNPSPPAPAATSISASSMNCTAAIFVELKKGA